MSATIAALAALAAIPYAVEGGKKLWSEYGAADVGGPQDFTAGRARSQELHDLTKAGLGQQISDVKGAAGGAIAASLATGQGTGITGFSPMGMAQAQQGEILGRKAVTGLEQQLLSLENERFNALIKKANDNVTDILSRFEYSKQRGQALQNLANSSGISEEEREIYQNAAMMYGGGGEGGVMNTAMAQHKAIAGLPQDVY